MKQIGFLISCLLFINMVFAQHNHIHGKVVDDVNKLPIEGVSITLLPINKTTITDENGSFVFNETKAQITSITFQGLDMRH